jgi:hypothetical protein
MKDADASWEKFLNPLSLRQNLVAASVFLVAYEMLRQALIGHLRSFFGNNWTLDEVCEVTPEYRENVLSLEKKEIVACAKWFRLHGGLEDDDLVTLKDITDQRNVIAHELPAIVFSNEKNISAIHLRSIYILTAKVDNWWLREIEIPTNPECDGMSDEEIERSSSLRVMLMSMLVELAEGDDSALVELYRLWKEAVTTSQNAQPGRQTCH